MKWNDKTVISIGGGKGGIGKSCFAANLGVVIASRGKSVILVDADLGGANLHTLIGIKYAQKTLDDFTSGRCENLEDVLLKTPYPNLKLISSANDILGIAQPNFKDRQKLYKGINNLDADVVIFDIAAGSNERAIDFFSLAPYGIVIIEPTPTSLENAFSFYKNMIFRILLRMFYQNRELKQFIIDISDPRKYGKYVPLIEIIEKLENAAPHKISQFKALFDPKNLQLFTVINRLQNTNHMKIGENFVKIVKRYLSIDITLLGILPFEKKMDEAIIQRVPICIKYPQCAYSNGVTKCLQTFFFSF
ncbi:MAG: P-loop NTPase [Chitinispirillia bacterium]|jgi:flagellar biosynthesis protein FlhG